MSRLQRAIQAAHAAVLARAGEAPHPDRVGGPFQDLNRFDENATTGSGKCHNIPPVNEQHSSGPDRRPAPPTLQAAQSAGATAPAEVASGFRPELEGPSWASCSPHGAPAPRVLPALPMAEEVLAGQTFSRGALALWRFLHERSRLRASSQSWAVLPVQDVYHLPAVIVAAALGYSERHLYRLAAELRAGGVLDARGHVADVGKLRRYSGTLWAVKLQPDAPRPRLRFWDFRHTWRPTFADEYHSEQGAWREVQAVLEEVSEPLDPSGRQGRLQALAQTWAAASRTPSPPAGGGSDMRPGAGLRGVARDLSGLLGLAPRRRHREVTRLAAEVADALNERSRLRQWAGTIYTALTAENEQRPGLQALALQLERLAVDLAEAPGVWRSPGAVLAARLRT